MCYTVLGKAEFVPTDTRLEKPCEARKKIPLSRHNLGFVLRLTVAVQLGLTYCDHMKIIRTFSYLESRSDYLFYLSIPTLIARNENSRYHGLLTLVSALALLKNTHFYDIINTSKYF